MGSAVNGSIGQRLQGVDVLRALAILFVLMNHVNMRLRFARIPYTEGLPEQLVTSLVWNGQRGVQIFFAVSGFLITAMSLRRWESLSRVSPRGFYLMRFARIVPLLFAEANPMPIKYLLWRQGLIASPECRLPLTRISDELARRLESMPGERLAA